jgi:hypothetical protein
LKITLSLFLFFVFFHAVAEEPNTVRPFQYSNTERINWFRSLAFKEKDSKKRAFLNFKMAREMLFAGQFDNAIKEFNLLKTYYSPNEIIKEEEVWRFSELVEFYIGLSYLRIGEQQNCVGMNNDHSCLFPIEGKGIHMIREGSIKAIESFSKILKNNPNQSDSKWLLNLAWNTLGGYPKSVSPEWLIPPSVFESKISYPRFENKAEDFGINFEGLAGGVVLDDFNNDGHLDLMVSSISYKDPLRIFLSNKKSGVIKFTDVTKSSDLKGLKGSLNIMQADYNNDGNVDVFLSRGAWNDVQGEIPGSLLKGLGNGSFEDITAKSKILTTGPGQAVAWGDFNNDGLIDLLVAYESDGDKFYPTQLWKNNGNGTFTDVAKEVGLAAYHGFFKAATWGDYNNDGKLDLFLSNLNGSSLLLKNLGPDSLGVWHFSDVSHQAGISDPKHSFTSWFFDYDNDGYLDLFVSGYKATLTDIVADYQNKKNNGARAALFHNNKNGTFSNVSKSVGLDKVLLTMGANFGDINNDGYLDFYLGTGYPLLEMLIPNRLFQNIEGKKFVDITTTAGVGHLQKGHGVAFGDINEDGAQDIFEVLGGVFENDGFKRVLFINPGNKGNWIKLKLQGTRDNRSAIGARISVFINENGKKRMVHRMVSSGGSFGSGPLEQHIGVGAAKNIDRVEIYWPALKKVQILKNLLINKSYTIIESN